MQVVQTIDTLHSLNIRPQREITFRDPLNLIRHFSSKEFFQHYRTEKETFLSICEELFDINEPKNRSSALLPIQVFALAVIFCNRKFLHSGRKYFGCSQNHCNTFNGKGCK